MKRNIYRIILPGIIFLIVLVSSCTLVDANANQVDQEDYRGLLMKVDGKIRSLRFNRELTENDFINLENRYISLFPGDGGLKDEVKNSLQEFQMDPSEVEIEDLRSLREDIVKVAESEGVELSFIYEYAVLVILGVSVTLAFSVNMISRVFVNWEEVNEAKRKQSEIQDELKEARNENDTKRVHKLQKEQQKFMQEHMGTMMSPMKTMLVIFIPFIIVFSIMRGTYGGWVVAWLPFKFPWLDINLPLLSNFFKGTMVSLGFFGWYILSYFGLSQILRNILVPSE